MADRRKECASAIFDEVWGEYKCGHFVIRLYEVNTGKSRCDDCPYFKPGTPRKQLRTTSK